MNTALFDAFVSFDASARRLLQVVGRGSGTGRMVHSTTVNLRRTLAQHALSSAASDPDPRRDFAQIVTAAVAAGVAWTDIAAIVNQVREKNP